MNDVIMIADHLTESNDIIENQKILKRLESLVHFHSRARNHNPLIDRHQRMAPGAKLDIGLERPRLNSELSHPTAPI